MSNLSNKVISSNFQRLLQISESNAVADGTGSAAVLSLDIANSKVGIGTNTPSKTLEVIGTMNVSGSEYFDTSGSQASEIVSIISSGSIIPSTPLGDQTGSFDLGSATKPWRDLYLFSGSLVMIGDPEAPGGIHITANDFVNLKKGRSIAKRLDGTSKPGQIDASQINALTGGTTADSNTFIRLSVADEVRINAGGQEYWNSDEDNQIFNIGPDSTTYPLTIRPPVTASRDLLASGSLNVVANLLVRGNADIRGNLTFGNADTDSVTFGADISSSIIPDANNAYSLGANSKDWSSINVRKIATQTGLVEVSASLYSSGSEYNLGRAANKWGKLFVETIGVGAPVDNIYVGDLVITSDTIRKSDNDGYIKLAPLGSSARVAIGQVNTTDHTSRLVVDGTISSSKLEVAFGGISSSGAILAGDNITLHQFTGFTKDKLVRLHSNLDDGIVSVFQNNIEVITLNGANGGISASGDISASGVQGLTLKATGLTQNRIAVIGSGGSIQDDADLTYSGNTLSVPFITNVDTTHITASGNISASGQITASSFKGDGSGLTNVTATTTLPEGLISSSLQFGSSDNVNFNHITASGNISASKLVTGNDITASGAILSTGDNITLKDSPGFSHTMVKLHYHEDDGVVSVFHNNTEVITLNGEGGHITASGNISSSGLINVDGEVQSQGQRIGSFDGTNVRLGDSTTPTRLFGKTINTTANITASGNITASKIFASELQLNHLPTSQSGLETGQLFTLSGSQLPFETGSAGSNNRALFNVISSSKFILIA